MYIGNGHIFENRDDAIKHIFTIYDGKSFKKLKYPFISENMEYYISEDGIVFGFKKYKGFFLVTKIKISHRYKKGPTFKISLFDKREKEMYLAYAIYYTFILDKYDESLTIEYADGNPYNISIHNLLRKEEIVSELFKHNMNVYADMYNKKFNEVVKYITFFSYGHISEDDAKDITSESFFELCNSNVDGMGVGAWITISKFRLYDYMNKKIKFENILYDNGEEKLSECSTDIHTDILKYIRGNRTLLYLKLWANGETPTSIAESTGSTIGTVGSVITRKIQELRKICNNDILIWKGIRNSYL